jgi:integrase
VGLPISIGASRTKPLAKVANYHAKKCGKNLIVEEIQLSTLVSSELRLSIVGKLLGHTQASTIQRYAHRVDETLRAATEVFGQKVGI